MRLIPPRRLALLPLIILGCAPLFLAGCSPPPVPVSGKVTVGGEPLKTGTVTFFADAGNPTKAEPRGQIKEDGTYEVQTDGKPGAPPGTYKVIVIASGPPADSKDPYAKGPLLVNKKYISEKTSDLKVTVPSPNYDLTLTK